MDPFSDNTVNGTNEDSKNTTGGELYFNLGNISEDILKDSRKSFENGLPTSEELDSANIDTTAWGRVPTNQSVVNTFNNDPKTRKFQDVGLDGQRNEDEREHYEEYLNKMKNILTDSAYQALKKDPSGDKYKYYRGDDHDEKERNVLERYKLFNGLEGNSPTSKQSKEVNDGGYPTSATTRPDVEDINNDNNLTENERYYQYKVELKPSEMEVGKNFITNKFVTNVDTREGNKEVAWYQFKIPVRDYQKRVNNIQNFRSIRFMRMFLRGFEEPVVLRFARLELIRGEWRTYQEEIKQSGEQLGDDPKETQFNVGAVNIEENSEKTPVN
ncbi:MAG: cell surface protein SprA, partial [Flavobacteriales bacterium]